MTATALVVALCVATLLSAGVGARAGAGVREESARDALASLRNISDAQVAALRSAALFAAQEVARFLIEGFEHMTAMTETEKEKALAAWAELEAAAAAKEAAGGQRPAVDDGDEDEDSEEPESTADTIRRILREGLESRGIPPLDPLNISYIPINIDVPEVLRLQAKLEDLSFDGLASFRENVTYSLSIGTTITVAVNFDVLFPRLRVRTQYEADGYADAGLDIWGDGLIEILLYRLRVKGDIFIRIPYVLFSPTVNPCDISAAARSLKISIEGLFGGGLLSQLAGEIVSDVINEYILHAVFDLISTTVEDGVCGYLRSLKRSDYIAIYWKYIVGRPWSTMQ